MVTAFIKYCGSLLLEMSSLLYTRVVMTMTDTQWLSIAALPQEQWHFLHMRLFVRLLLLKKICYLPSFGATFNTLFHLFLNLLIR